MGADAEALTAFGTGIGSFAGVYPLMPFQVRALDETFAAVAASKWPFTSMDAPVLGKVGASAEALTTIAAAVRSFAAVGLTVFGQSRALGKDLTAFRAAVRSQ